MKYGRNNFPSQLLMKCYLSYLARLVIAMKTRISLAIKSDDLTIELILKLSNSICKYVCAKICFHPFCRVYLFVFAFNHIIIREFKCTQRLMCHTEIYEEMSVQAF